MFGTVGESQRVLILIDPIISTRTRVTSQGQPPPHKRSRGCARAGGGCQPSRPAQRTGRRGHQAHCRGGREGARALVEPAIGADTGVIGGVSWAGGVLGAVYVDDILPHPAGRAVWLGRKPYHGGATLRRNLGYSGRQRRADRVGEGGPVRVPRRVHTICGPVGQLLQSRDGASTAAAGGIHWPFGGTGNPPSSQQPL
jgi:hypothetical protein